MSNCIFLIRKNYLTLVTIVFAINILLLYFYLTQEYRFFFHSDAAVKLLLADSMLNNGFIAPDWFYANGDIWTFSPSLFAIPFVYIFGVTYKAHILSTHDKCYLPGIRIALFFENTGR